MNLRPKHPLVAVDRRATVPSIASTLSSAGRRPAVDGYLPHSS